MDLGIVMGWKLGIVGFKLCDCGLVWHIIVGLGSGIGCKVGY